MKAKFRKGMVVITLPRIRPARPSKSGKTLVVATSTGPRRTKLRVNGKSVVVIASAWIRTDNPAKSVTRKGKTTLSNRPIGKKARNHFSRRRDRRAI